jgi:ATP-dependent helicase/nuclease subunit A
MTDRASSAAEGCLPDATERERAATTFDRNIVVTAGAGTGKTTLLVDRLVHLLMRDPDPVAITQVVALTFTNKALGWIKLQPAVWKTRSTPSFTL